MVISVWADVYRSIDESGTHCIEESLRRPGEIPVGLYRRYGPYSEADAHRLFERLIELPSVIARKPDVTIIERPTSSLRSERVIVRVWQHDAFLLIALVLFVVTGILSTTKRAVEMAVLAFGLASLALALMFLSGTAGA